MNTEMLSLDSKVRRFTTAFSTRFRVGSTVLALLAMACAPLVIPPFYTQFLALVLNYGIWALSFGLIMGHLGLTTFGHAAVFGGGAYAAALVGLHFEPSLPWSVLAGAMVGSLIGGSMGLVLGRLSGVAFAIGSLAFGGMVYQIAHGWVEVTGGSDGLVGLPLPTIGGIRLSKPGLYWASLSLTIISVGLMITGLRTRFGMILHAVRDNPIRAEASGIPVFLVRCITLALSGAMAGSAGAMSAYIIGSVSPSSVNWTASGDVLVMGILGGVRSIAGPIAGSIVFTILEQLLSQVLVNYRLVLGLAFIAIVVLLPSGLSTAFHRLTTWGRERLHV